MKRPDVIKQARIHRLELILLGMALATTGDRDRVLETIDRDNLQSDLIDRCLKAIETKDPDDIEELHKVFRQWGVEIRGTVLESLVGKLNVANAERKLTDAMARASQEPTSESIVSVERAADSLRKTRNRYEATI